MILKTFLAVSSVVIITATAAAAQSRLALVIGNDDYESLPDLRKARNDARAVSGALQQMGFGVTSLEDADRRTFSRSLSEFSNSVSPGDDVIFYYAGHGVEVNGLNYLLPTDAPPARPGDEVFLVSESFAVNDVLKTIQDRGAKVTVMILDACRDNPFPKEGTRSAGSTRGLAAVTPIEGSFILFSAGAGQSALDSLGSEDANPNSVFTRALLPLLGTPGMPMQSIARGIRVEVEEMASKINHKQRPAYYDELTGDFVVNASADAPAMLAPSPSPQPQAIAAAPAVVAPSAPAGPSACDMAALDWPNYATLPDPAQLRVFAATYADCPTYSRTAATKADELERRIPREGELTLEDGSTYVGNILNNQPQGQGVQTYPDGTRYEGLFSMGYRQGQGKLTYADGSVYKGTFLNGLPGGLGRITYADGSSYVGDFVKGYPEGRGKYTSKDGEQVEADWKAGEVQKIIARKSSPTPKVETWRVKPGVSDGYLNVRGGPGTMYPVLFKLDAGVGGISVSDCRKPDAGGGKYEFCFVFANGKTGWASLNGLERQ